MGNRIFDPTNWLEPKYYSPVRDVTHISLACIISAARFISSPKSKDLPKIGLEPIT